MAIDAVKIDGVLTPDDRKFWQAEIDARRLGQ
jgi:hypothetical protein